MYGISIYLIFYACLGLRFLNVETNPGPRRTVPNVCTLLCSNVRGLAWNRDLTVASSRYDILLGSKTFVSDIRHVTELLVPGFGCPVLCRGRMSRARGTPAYVRDGYMEPFALQNLSVVVAKCCFLGCWLGVVGFYNHKSSWCCSL